MLKTRTVKRLLFASCLLGYPFTASWAESLLNDPFATNQQVNQSPKGNGLGFNTLCGLHATNNQAWTLVDVVNQALCNNPQTQQAWANARFQAAQVGIAKAAYLPTVTLSTPVSRSMNSASSSLQVTSIGSTSTGKSAQPLTRFTPVISLTYLLYNFGAREAQLENAEKILDAANWTQDATLQTVMFAAIQAYYSVFATQSAVEAALISENASAEAVTAAQKRHEVGAVAVGDVLLAQTAWAQAKLNSQKTTGEANIALGNLANAMGLEADYSLHIAPPYLTKPDAKQHEHVHRLIEEAKTLRPDLAAAEAKIKAAQASVKAAEAGHLPSLSLIGNYGYNHTSLPSDTQSWTVGMQISVPLFNGFNTTYQIRSAKEQLAVQRANFDQLEQSVSLDVWQSYQLLNTAYESFNSSEAVLASALQSEKVALGRYSAGVGNILDVLNAQASHATARMQLIQFQYAWLIQKAQLAKALGRLDFSVLPAK